MAWDDRATSYVMGLLTPEEAAEFEHALKAGDTDCVDGVRGAGQMGAALAAGLPPAKPRSELKSRLLHRVRPRIPGFGALRAGQGAWRETGVRGVTFRPLYFDKTSGLLTMLLKLGPGSSYPAHVHTLTEQCLVLEGDVSDATGTYGVGDFTWAEPGTLHRDVSSVNGAIILLVVAPENEILPA